MLTYLLCFPLQLCLLDGALTLNGIQFREVNFLGLPGGLAEAILFLVLGHSLFQLNIFSLFASRL